MAEPERLHGARVAACVRMRLAGAIVAQRFGPIQRAVVAEEIAPLVTARGARGRRPRIDDHQLIEAKLSIRVDVWLQPFDYDDTRGDLSFQPVEAMFDMGWGGLIGRGFGDGSPDRVPYANSDFIVASIGEELGLTAVIAVVLLYGLIVERALRAALVCRDGFGKLVATGLAGVFTIQVFVVIGGVTRLIPLTGLTTPFLSYGGSSLVANWVIIALLLRISDQEAFAHSTVDPVKGGAKDAPDGANPSRR